jgi:hypothetical protein
VSWEQQEKSEGGHDTAEKETERAGRVEREGANHIHEFGQVFEGPRHREIKERLFLGPRTDIDEVVVHTDQDGPTLCVHKGKKRDEKQTRKTEGGSADRQGRYRQADRRRDLFVIFGEHFVVLEDVHHGGEVLAAEGRFGDQEPRIVDQSLDRVAGKLQSWKTRESEREGVTKTLKA